MNYSVPDIIYSFDYFRQEDVCRLCWHKGACNEIILGKKCKDNYVLEQIKDCLDIDITEVKYLNKICTNCCTLLEEFYNFKNFCKENDKKYRDMCESSNNLLSNCADDSKEIYSDNEPLDGYLDTLIHSGTELVNFDTNTTSGGETLIQFSKRKKTKIKSIKCVAKTPLTISSSHLKFDTEIQQSQVNSLKETQYKCFGCEKMFQTIKKRQRHERNFCKGLNNGYKCSLCNRFLPSRRMFDKHMEEHTENTIIQLPEDIFKCKKCHESFKTKTDLQKHLLNHTIRKRNFVCENCGRLFTRQDYLHKHKLTHTGVRGHACPHCDLRFTQRSSLTVHIRKHTGERPYSCDVCPQRCISSSNLRAHRRRHLGIKKYECTICNRKFGYKISLDEHVAATHERSQTYPCQHCGATYTRVRGLRRHLLAKHGGDKKLDKDKYTVAEVDKNPIDDEKNAKVYSKTQDGLVT